jgi:hypothetical protein
MESGVPTVALFLRAGLVCGFLFAFNGYSLGFVSKKTFVKIVQARAEDEAFRRITKVVTTALRALYTDVDNDEGGAADGFLGRS